jgi:hypothetical protein
MVHLLWDFQDLSLSLWSDFLFPDGLFDLLSPHGKPTDKISPLGAVASGQMVADEVTIQGFTFETHD